MKKLLILAVSYNIIVAFVNKANGQAFSMLDTAKSAYVNTSITIDNDITNNTTYPFSIQWKVLNTDFPDDWLGTGFSICDNNLCYTNATDDLWNPIKDTGITQTSNPYIPGIPANFDLGLDLSGTTSFGTHYVTVELNGGKTSRLSTFIVSRQPTGITTISNKSVDIGVYPNPAQNVLYISYSGKVNTKNIVVYNEMGKKVAIYKANNNETTIDLNNYVSGLYFLHLVDDNGNIIGEQKFIHQ